MWNALLLLQHLKKARVLESLCGIIPVNFSFPSHVSFFLPEKNVPLVFPKNTMFSTTLFLLHSGRNKAFVLPVY